VTTYASYGFTRADPAAALAAAERVAKDAGSQAGRRLNEDGSIDVALMKGREFQLYLVSPDGTAELVELRSPPPARRLWLALMWLGLALLPIAFAAAAIRYPQGTDDDSPPEVVLAAVGLVAALVGGLAARRYNLGWHLSKRFTDPEEWRRFRERSAWSPRSLAQLAAAERLAYHHEGKAMVGELPDGAAEVVTEEAGRLSRHCIDETGVVTELPGAGRTNLYRVGRAMAALGVPASFGLFVLGGSLTGPFGSLLGALAGMSVAVLGSVLAQRDAVERRVPRSQPGTWYLLRTNAEPRGD
jgi:hypothetical protein